ncbi:unnamed protein product [Durusdinium trenchii]|uniref:Prolyl 4-hydroxylase alpha subunit domain-containing protein n=1 Tax=Durusdinium trenchii TaxID=1381693 RepID=A0ABP0PT35_9DINO
MMQWTVRLVASLLHAGAMVTKEDCGGADPQAWISPSWASRGYHVLCLASECPSGTGDEHCSASGPVAKVCWGGVQDDCEELTGLASVLREEGLNSLVSLQDLLVVQRSVLNQERYEKLLQARLKHNKPPLNFAFYAVEGDGMPPRKLESLQGQSGMILAFEGGTFVWPGIQLGYRRNVTLQPRNEASIELQIETRSLQPLVVEISSFLDENDCQHIIDKALPHIRKSSVKHMDQDVGKPDSNWRTSSTYFMPSDDAVLRRIDDRVRLATVFFYLTDVEEGGETNFPRADGLPQPHDFGDCSRGISVYPRRGRIIIFYSQHPSAEADEYSLHGGCQVKRGVKWSANKWIWNKPMDYIQE